MNLIPTTSPQGRSPPAAVQGEYDLSLNALTNLVAYHPSAAGLSIRSQRALAPGSHFCYFTAHAPQPTPTWRSIQTSPTTHTNPLSALLYMNHSCRPNLEVHTYAPDPSGRYPRAPLTGPQAGRELAGAEEHGVAGEIVVAGGRGVEVGDELSFFYPSTEWAFDRPFQCACEEVGCLGEVRGAEALREEEIAKGGWFLNGHIEELLATKGGGLKN